MDLRRSARLGEVLVRVASVQDSTGTRLLPLVLSIIAGSVDSIGFVGLGGLFTAHITGNLVILAAYLSKARYAPIAILISVPVFVAVLMLGRAFVGVLERSNIETLKPLLLLQWLLLVGFLVLATVGGPHLALCDRDGIIAGMLGVSAMATQNVVVGHALRGAPSTAVMTTNITRLVLDIGQVLLDPHSPRTPEAAFRARQTLPVIAGFAVGCGLGAGCQARFGLESLMLPTGLALLALLVAFVPAREAQESPKGSA
jgi:uncharacterized membrane protein YoaK (UPF0700 family)